YAWRPVHCAPEIADSSYYGFSNGTLWPLYHSMPNREMSKRDEWMAYQTVNEEFARITLESTSAQDLIWIHDYQLSLVPQFLRQKLGSAATIGFLLHIPFPPWSLFRTLPWAKEILRGMLGASLIVFHIRQYCNNFFECVERMLGLRASR